MKVTTEELERCEVLLTLEIEPDQQEKLLKKAAQRISREINIPGFRPGKAPYNVIVRRFGLQALQTEALEESAEKLITDAMAQVNVTPFTQIKLDKVEWEPNLTIKIVVPTQPKIELSDYRNLRLEPKPVEVADEEVEKALKNLQEQRATWAPVERPAQIGDMISMTVTEKDGDKVLVDHNSTEYVLTVPDEDKADEDEDEVALDLTTPLLGLSAGENKTFTLTYPEDFDNEDYAGKEITFEVEVSGIKQKELDPLDDDFAQQVGDFENLEALKEKFRENIQQQRQRQNDFELGNQALDQIVEATEKVEWPLSYEEEQIDHEIEHREHHLKEAGLTLDSYLSVENKTMEQLREETREHIVKQLKYGLVMGKLAELEKLGVSQMEVLQQAKMIADIYGGGDRMWQSILSSESRQNMIANDVLSNKVIQRLAAIVKGEAPEIDTTEAVGESTLAEQPPTGDEAESAEVVDSMAEETGPETELTSESDPDQA